MKTRRGFVSNSSSSSFIIAYPKDRLLRLGEVESYVGGYTDSTPDEVKDLLSYIIWKSQFPMKQCCLDDVTFDETEHWWNDEWINKTKEWIKEGYYVKYASFEEYELGDEFGFSYDEADKVTRGTDRYFKDESKVLACGK